MSFRDSFLKGVFTVPGDGCIDYLPLLKILYQNKYNKWLVIEAEQDPDKANPYIYAQKGYYGIKYTKQTEKLFEALMGKKAEKRFNFIQENANFINNLDI